MKWYTSTRDLLRNILHTLEALVTINQKILDAQ